MKALDYIKASKVYKANGEEHKKRVAEWQKRKQKMVSAFNTDDNQPISVKQDIWPEGMIFYTTTGYQKISDDSLIEVDFTTIDNGYDYTQHIQPTYILVRDKNSGNAPATLDNTTMYRISYIKNNETDKENFVVETLIDNLDETTAKFFPNLFASLDVITRHYGVSPVKNFEYSPLKDYADEGGFMRRDKMSNIADFYSSSILTPMLRFKNKPKDSFEIEQEL